MSELNRKLYRQFKQRINGHEIMKAVTPHGEGYRIHGKFIRRLSKAVRYLNIRLSR